MIELLQVGGDDARLERLMQLYLYEWSGLLPVPIEADARFRYADMAAYEDREGHAAYLFLDGEVPIGFGLVAKHGEGAWRVAELFLIAGARGGGLGADLARRLLATRPGPWTWTVRPERPAALAFWRRAFPTASEAVEVGADGITRTRMHVTVS
ncbi:MAG: hypothetical protein H6719_18375 [Sandaracinaceae bacterium]|nr:hypothetical protein [Sandaracinaceae bacterium]